MLDYIIILLIMEKVWKKSFQRYAYTLSFYDHEVGYVTTCSNHLVRSLWYFSFIIIVKKCLFLSSFFEGFCLIESLLSRCFQVLSRCFQDAFKMLSRCFQDAFKMLSRCFQDDKETSLCNGIVLFKYY
jgi:hypothetical protein